MKVYPPDHPRRARMACACLLLSPVAVNISSRVRGYVSRVPFVLHLKAEAWIAVLQHSSLPLFIHSSSVRRTRTTIRFSLWRNYLNKLGVLLRAALLSPSTRSDTTLCNRFLRIFTRAVEYLTFSLSLSLKHTQKQPTQPTPCTLLAHATS